MPTKTPPKTPRVKTVGGVGVTDTGYSQYFDDNVKNYSNYYQKLTDIALNHPIISSAIKLTLGIISSTKISIQPFSNSQKHLREAQMIEDMVTNFEKPLETVLKNTAKSIFFGANLQEWEGVRNSQGQIMMTDFHNRPLETISQWNVDNNGKLISVEQSVQGSNTVIPRYKLIYSRDDTFVDTPQGSGLLREIFTSVKDLEGYLRTEKIAILSDTRGVPVVRGPLGEMRKQVKAGRMTEDEYNELVGSLKKTAAGYNKAEDGAYLFDSEVHKTADETGKPSNKYKWDISLLNTQTTALPDLARIVARISHRIITPFFTTSILLGSTGGGSGSHALSKENMKMNNNFNKNNIDASINTLNRDIIKTTYLMNGLNPMESCYFESSKIKYQDLIEATNAFNNLRTSISQGYIDKDDKGVNTILTELGIENDAELYKDVDINNKDNNIGDTA